jgi:prepilin-type N-terminal cleavage/methylation domain-containing protein
MLHTLKKNRGGFTLVEIMIVVAIIALLAAIAVPNFMRARKRSQATSILNDLRLISNAMDQYAIECNGTTGGPCNWSDIQNYLKTGTVLYESNATDVLGNPFGWSGIDSNIEFSGASFAALSDVAPASFWSPYSPASNF